MFFLFVVEDYNMSEQHQENCLSQEDGRGLLLLPDYSVFEVVEKYIWCLHLPHQGSSLSFCSIFSSCSISYFLSKSSPQI